MAKPGLKPSVSSSKVGVLLTVLLCWWNEGVGWQNGIDHLVLCPMLSFYGWGNWGPDWRRDFVGLNSSRTRMRSRVPDIESKPFDIMYPCPSSKSFGPLVGSRSKFKALGKMKIVGEMTLQPKWASESGIWEDCEEKTPGAYRRYEGPEGGMSGQQGRAEKAQRDKALAL